MVMMLDILDSSFYSRSAMSMSLAILVSREYNWCLEGLADDEPHPGFLIVGGQHVISV
jgi:hypothetical protein